MLFSLFFSVASCDSKVNKVQPGPLRGSPQLFLLLPHWLPSAQIKSEAQPTPQGIWYYSENTDALLARVRSLFWEHIPLPQSDTEWIRSMSDTGLVLLELMWWCCSGQEMSCKLGGHAFFFFFSLRAVSSLASFLTVNPSCLISLWIIWQDP